MGLESGEVRPTRVYFQEEFAEAEKVFAFYEENEIWYPATVVLSGSSTAKIKWLGDAKYDLIKTHEDLWKIPKVKNCVKESVIAVFALARRGDWR